MQIITISPSRQSQQQVWLKFDEGTLLPFKVDDVIRLKLSKFTNITSELYQSILLASANYLLLEYSLRQIAISPKTEKSLNQKLKIYCQKLKYKYNFELDFLYSLIDPVVKRIVDDGLIDNQAYIDHVLRKYPRKSMMEISFILRQQGINFSPKPNQEQEIEKIKNIILKKYHSYNLADYNAKNKLIGNLARKGFPIEFIKTAIDETM
ncbi:RecX family transcriptional regulator [Candidatus Shapirobacteria bacterium]|nr:RecX family transcriptional regulator [Candidatus Shapirobacteria bacterium]